MTAETTTGTTTTAAVTTLRFGRLEVQIAPAPGGAGAGARVVLAGRLDDSSLLGELAGQVPPGDVVIECGGITFVNSYGIREWVRLLRALEDRGAITLVAVAESLMAQMNLIPEFARRVQIASFHAQYVCPACGAEAVPVVDAVAHAAELAALRMPPVPCPECGAQMELADFPERYLNIFSPG
jgi:predicted RNA-binding Zn-ribbon protein involved in translation (DUF1610 family)